MALQNAPMKNKVSYQLRVLVTLVTYLNRKSELGVLWLDLELMVQVLKEKSYYLYRVNKSGHILLKFKRPFSIQIIDNLNIECKHRELTKNKQKNNNKKNNNNNNNNKS